MAESKQDEDVIKALNERILHLEAVCSRFIDVWTENGISFSSLPKRDGEKPLSTISKKSEKREQAKSIEYAKEKKIKQIISDDDSDSDIIASYSIKKSSASTRNAHPQPKEPLKTENRQGAKTVVKEMPKIDDDPDIFDDSDEPKPVKPSKPKPLPKKPASSEDSSSSEDSMQFFD